MTQLENGQRGFYREYYNDPDISVWREIGARDKAENVIMLWSKWGGGSHQWQILVAATAR